MGDLFDFMDDDADYIKVAEAVEIDGRHVVILVGDMKGWSSAVYLNRDAALDLAAVLVRYYGAEELTKEGTD